MAYNVVTVNRGRAGWGGPLVLQATETCNKILCVTGENVSPIAVKLAELTGCELVNGWKTNIPDEEVLAVVIDCGGTARCGVYPKKGLYTINLTAVGQSGPLAKFITEDIYVSDVTEECFEVGGEPVAKAAPVQDKAAAAKAEAKERVAQMEEGKKKNFVASMGIAVGKVVNKFFDAGRDSINIVIKNILPFMAFTSTILGIISASGLGDIIASTIAPFCNTLPGMLLISVVCSLPFLSPILGPGAVIAQVVGVMVGDMIARGGIKPQLALPALFAIDGQVGGDFVPVGLSLGEAEPETIELGVPAVLFSRLVTGPLAVIIAFVASIGLYA